MSRLVILVGLLAVVFALVYLAVTAIGTAARSGRTRLAAAQPGSVMVQRMSHILLVALIAYAAIWGAG